MNRETYKEAKMYLEEITQLLKEGSLTEEEKQNFEMLQVKLSGQLCSIWWPFDWGRRSIMIALFLAGLYGLIEGSNHFMWAWLVLLSFSPRFVGELSFFLGRVFRVLR